MTVIRSALIALAVLIGVGGTAAASDYSHVCRTADGRYEINDGRLSETSNDAVEIPFETISETTLARRRGYCESRRRRFEFEARSYIHRIRFMANGAPVEVDALCELAADGLPAAYSCEREVVTQDSPPAGTPHAGTTQDGRAAPPTVTSRWNHNGSLMRLEATGSDRSFLYERPRQGMLDAGAGPGDPVFLGRQDGRRYSGTAYIYSKSCGRVPYAATGTATADDRSVVLRGDAPRLAADCTIRGNRPDSLRFELVDR